MLRRTARRFLTLAFAYAAAWTAVYSIVMGSDFRYFGEYLCLAWTSPGEVPLIINGIASGLALVLLGAIEIVRAIRRAANRSHQWSELER